MKAKRMVDGPKHPDMFSDEDTPIKVPMDVDVHVYKVNVVYHEPQDETFYIVATNEEEAENAAWDASGYHIDCTMENTEYVDQLEDDDELDDLFCRGGDGCKTAKDLIQKKLDEGYLND